MPLTREYLYNLICDNFNLIEEKLSLKQNKQFVIDVFRDSAKFVSFFEKDIASDEDYSFERFNILVNEALKMRHSSASMIVPMPMDKAYLGHLTSDGKNGLYSSIVSTDKAAKPVREESETPGSLKAICPLRPSVSTWNLMPPRYSMSSS